MKPIHGFELIKEQTIEELNTKARLYRHLRTGAELLSLINADENKSFMVAFRTPPATSNGVAHIMEHSVLCGSRKYPVKEPFIELMKGSLNTFLNAFTYPDKTVYPLASQNLQDFYNLIDVYLDAVFYPRITPETMQQEGWHFELEDPDQPMTFKGVVFNEMKGAYSSPDGILNDMSQRLLFPDNIYGLDSGGDPAEIPNLTYEEFKNFHDTYYHPSNARFFFCGDDDPDTRLKIVDDFLVDFQPIPVRSQIALQPAWDAPRRKVVPFEAAGEDDSCHLTVNWLLPEIGDIEQMLALEILNHILTGSPAAPLRRALIESGLGEDLAGRGVDTGLRQMMASWGMRGVKKEDVQKVEDLILQTLTDLSENGIDPATIAASLNTVEFDLRENNTGSFPRGLALGLGTLSTWLYDADPIMAISFEKPLSAVKSRLSSDPHYFEELIKAHLLNNPHRISVVLEPDPTLAERRAEAEIQRLAAAQSRMSAEELHALKENTETLKLRQETPDTPEALATIPMLKLSDLDRNIRHIPVEEIEGEKSRILFHDLFTNGILYLDLGFNLRALPKEYVPFVPLFGRALLEMGTQTADYVQLTQRIGTHTGGMGTVEFNSPVPQSDECQSWLFIRTKALTSKVPELIAILNDILLTGRLDLRERFRQIVLEEKSGFEASITDLGTRLVNLRLKSRFHESFWAAEQMSGVSHLFFLRNLLERIDQDWEGIQKILETIRALLVNSNNMVWNLTLDRAGFEQTLPSIHGFIAQLPAAPVLSQSWQTERRMNSEGLVIPSQVNFVGKAGNLFQTGYTYSASLMVISQYLNTTWMWEKVRVQGGAYGANFVIDPFSGYQAYLSYRDPNLLETLAAYDQTAAFLKKLKIHKDELTKSIIGTIGEMDSYQLPDAKGFTSLSRTLLGITEEQRQIWRNQVLNTKADEFHALSAHLADLIERSPVVVLGSPDAIQKASAKLGLEITKLQ